MSNKTIVRYEFLKAQTLHLKLNLVVYGAEMLGVDGNDDGDMTHGNVTETSREFPSPLVSTFWFASF